MPPDLPRPDVTVQRPPYLARFPLHSGGRQMPALLASDARTLLWDLDQEISMVPDTLRQAGYEVIPYEGGADVLDVKVDLVSYPEHTKDEEVLDEPNPSTAPRGRTYWPPRLACDARAPLRIRHHYGAGLVPPLIPHDVAMVLAHRLVTEFGPRDVLTGGYQTTYQQLIFSSPHWSPYRLALLLLPSPLWPIGDHIRLEFKKHVLVALERHQASNDQRAAESRVRLNSKRDNIQLGDPGLPQVQWGDGGGSGRPEGAP